MSTNFTEFRPLPYLYIQNTDWKWESINKLGKEDSNNTDGFLKLTTQQNIHHQERLKAFTLPFNAVDSQTKKHAYNFLKLWLRMSFLTAYSGKDSIQLLTTCATLVILVNLSKSLCLYDTKNVTS